jgi:hypothetical protein
VSPRTIFDGLSPLVRVGTAVAPFAVAIFTRLILGANRLTRWLVSVGVMWFAANFLMAPYSTGMRPDIQSLRTLLP